MQISSKVLDLTNCHLVFESARPKERWKEEKKEIKRDKKWMGKAPKQTALKLTGLSK